MPTAERYEVAPVVLEHDTDLFLQLRQLNGFEVSTNAQKSRMRAAGSVDSLAWITGRAKPTASLTTRDLAAALASISPSAGLVVGVRADFHVFERDVGNVWTGAGRTFAAKGGGFIYPESLAASVDDTDGALLTCTFIPFWNGTDDPIAVENVADIGVVPAPQFGSQYFMGPLFVNGTAINGVTSVTVNFGLTCSGTTQTPGPYDRLCAITDRSPSIQFTGLKLDEIQSLFYGQMSNVAVYFQAGVQFGDRVPYGTASHVKLTATAADIEHGTVGGKAPEDATDQFTIRPVGPLSLSLASTIP
jgi:hypothetical protein